MTMTVETTVTQASVNASDPNTFALAETQALAAQILPAASASSAQHTSEAEAEAQAESSDEGLEMKPVGSYLRSKNKGKGKAKAKDEPEDFNAPRSLIEYETSIETTGERGQKSVLKNVWKSNVCHTFVDGVEISRNDMNLTSTPEFNASPTPSRRQSLVVELKEDVDQHLYALGSTIDFLKERVCKNPASTNAVAATDANSAKATHDPLVVHSNAPRSNFRIAISRSKSLSTIEHYIKDFSPLRRVPENHIWPKQNDMLESPVTMNSSDGDAFSQHLALSTYLRNMDGAWVEGTEGYNSERVIAMTAEELIRLYNERVSFEVCPQPYVMPCNTPRPASPEPANFELPNFEATDSPGFAASLEALASLEVANPHESTDSPESATSPNVSGSHELAVSPKVTFSPELDTSPTPVTSPEDARTEPGSAEEDNEPIDLFEPFRFFRKNLRQVFGLRTAFFVLAEDAETFTLDPGNKSDYYRMPIFEVGLSKSSGIQLEAELAEKEVAEEWSADIPPQMPKIYRKLHQVPSQALILYLRGKGMKVRDIALEIAFLEDDFLYETKTSWYKGIFYPQHWEFTDSWVEMIMEDNRLEVQFWDVDLDWQGKPVPDEYKQLQADSKIHKAETLIKKCLENYLYYRFRGSIMHRRLHLG